MRYLLDTCIVSELVRPDRHRKLQARFDLRKQQCALASLVVAELRFGIRRLLDGARQRELSRRIETVIEGLPVLPFDVLAADWLADERARLEGHGEPIDLADLIIAATAARGTPVQLTVVTRNVRHFERLNIHVEDWTAR